LNAAKDSGREGASSVALTEEVSVASHPGLESHQLWQQAVSESHIPYDRLVTRLPTQTVEYWVSFDEGQQEGPATTCLFEILKGLLSVARESIDPRLSVIAAGTVRRSEAMPEKSLDALLSVYCFVCREIFFLSLLRILAEGD
jgi:hypothetical protein